MRCVICKEFAENIQHVSNIFITQADPNFLHKSVKILVKKTCAHSVNSIKAIAQVKRQLVATRTAKKLLMHW